MPRLEEKGLTSAPKPNFAGGSGGQNATASSKDLDAWTPSPVMTAGVCPGQAFGACRPRSGGAVGSAWAPHSYPDHHMLS